MLYSRVFVLILSSFCPPKFSSTKPTSPFLCLLKTCLDAIHQPNLCFSNFWRSAFCCALMIKLSFCFSKRVVVAVAFRGPLDLFRLWNVVFLNSLRYWYSLRNLRFIHIRSWIELRFLAFSVEVLPFVTFYQMLSSLLRLP